MQYIFAVNFGTLKAGNKSQAKLNPKTGQTIEKLILQVVTRDHKANSVYSKPKDKQTPDKA